MLVETSVIASCWGTAFRHRPKKKNKDNGVAKHGTRSGQGGDKRADGQTDRGTGCTPDKAPDKAWTRWDGAATAIVDNSKMPGQKVTINLCRKRLY